MRAGVGYYLRHDPGAPRDILMRSSAATLGALIAAEFPDPAQRLPAAARIWLVLYGRRTDPLTGRPDLSSILTTRFRRSGMWTAKGATLALYVRSSH